MFSLHVSNTIIYYFVSSDPIYIFPYMGPFWAWGGDVFTFSDKYDVIVNSYWHHEPCFLWHLEIAHYNDSLVILNDLRLSQHMSFTLRLVCNNF